MSWQADLCSRLASLGPDDWDDSRFVNPRDESNPIVLRIKEFGIPIDPSLAERAWEFVGAINAYPLAGPGCGISAKHLMVTGWEDDLDRGRSLIWVTYRSEPWDRIIDGEDKFRQVIPQPYRLAHFGLIPDGPGLAVVERNPGRVRRATASQ